MATATRAEGATRKLYLNLHRWMCMAKALDDRMHILVKQGRAPFVGSSRGHEGIQVASTAAIGPDDWLVPHYRGLANRAVADRAAGYGIGGVTVDGTDVPAWHGVCREAVARARRGEGPTLIGAKIWRINSHTSEDNHLKYRTRQELDEAAHHDPLNLFSAWLVERRWITAEGAAEVQAACDAEASE